MTVIYSRNQRNCVETHTYNFADAGGRIPRVQS